jgi:hypothetical protein
MVKIDNILWIPRETVQSQETAYRKREESNTSYSREEIKWELNLKKKGMLT